MAAFKSLLSRFWPWKKSPQIGLDGNVAVETEEAHLVKALGRFESYAVKLQSVLIWENPVVSALCVVAVNIVFWIIISFEYRFYFLVCMGTLIMFSYYLWVQAIWPEIRVPQPEVQDQEEWTPIHPSVLSIPEVSHYLSQAHIIVKDYYSRLKDFRTQQPGVFCSVMSGGFIFLAIVGRMVPGVLIGYILVMLIMIGPGFCIHLLPPSVVAKLKSFQLIFAAKSKETDSEVEDYLPEQNNETLAVLKQANELTDSHKDDDDEDSRLLAEEFGIDTDNGDSSGTRTSFTGGLSFMHSYNDESTDDLDANNFELSSDKLPTSGTKNIDPLDPEYDQSDDELNEEAIQFQSTHFNGEDSSEDEAGFSKGLSFKSRVAEKSESQVRSDPMTLGEILTKSAVEAVSKNIATIGAIGHGVLASVISASNQEAAPPSTEDKESSGDSTDDFEMISEEDLS